MKFEQAPDRSPTDEVSASETETLFENIPEALRNESLFLTGIGILSALGSAGCDISKTYAPENTTTIVTVQKESEKKFGEGEIFFKECEPDTRHEGGRNVTDQISSILVVDPASVTEEGIGRFFGARFISRSFEGDQETKLFVTFFEENGRNVLHNPCAMQRILQTSDQKERDRYTALVTRLDVQINVLRGLKHLDRQSTPEAYAIQADIETTVSALNREFGEESYNKKVVNAALIQ